MFASNPCSQYVVCGLVIVSISQCLSHGVILTCKVYSMYCSVLYLRGNEVEELPKWWQQKLL